MQAKSFFKSQTPQNGDDWKIHGYKICPYVFISSQNKNDGGGGDDDDIDRLD